MKIDVTIIGGDTRFAYAKESIEKYFKLTHTKSNHLKERLKITDYMLLPLPYCRHNKIVGTNYPKEWLAYLQDALSPYTVILAGKIDDYFNNYFIEFKTIDFLEDSEFINMNAKLTVDGVMENLIKNNLFNGVNKVLVIGWGRIGKGLCQKLVHQEIPCVSVFSTSQSKRTQIQEMGCHFYDSTDDITTYNLIINTAPAQVLSQKDFSLLTSNQIIIELASGAGGFPKKYRMKYLLNVTDYLGIPGKQFPVKAGKILGKTIIEQIESENQDIIEGGTVEWISNN